MEKYMKNHVVKCIALSMYLFSGMASADCTVALDIPVLSKKETKQITRELDLRGCTIESAEKAGHGILVRPITYYKNTDKPSYTDAFGDFHAASSDNQSFQAVRFGIYRNGIACFEEIQDLDVGGNYPKRSYSKAPDQTIIDNMERCL
jgi:hypothetical protein